MGRPYGTKNVMRSPEEKEKIVLEYLNKKCSKKIIAEKYNISRRLFQIWVQLYEVDGIKGFISKTGKNDNPNIGTYNRHPTEIEKLQLELLKKEIEIARLKKGYAVKGVGAQKEFVTIFEKNTK